MARRQPRFAAATGLVALAFVAFAPLLSERPWLFTLLFCTLTLDAVLALRAGAGAKAVWLLPLCYVLWANVHIQFVYRLGLLALACGAPLIDLRLGRARPGETAAAPGSRGWWALLALTGLCFLATLVNPYGARLYGVVFEFARQSGFYQVISELKALEFRGVGDWMVLFVTVAAGFALGRRPKLDTFELLLLATIAYLSFRSRRDLGFVVIGAAAILATPRRPGEAAADRFVITRRRAVLVGIMTGLVLVITGWARDLSERRLAEKVGEKFPAVAAAVIERRNDPGPLYNHFNWGDTSFGPSPGSR